MQILDVAAVLVCLVAALAFINARYWKLPSSIGVTVGGLLMSLVLIGLISLNVPWAIEFKQMVRGIEFDDFVFEGVLSFLLFAGALGVNSHALWKLRAPVILFALCSTAISILLVGFGTYGLLNLFGIEFPLLYCILFGSLISPTDPVSVLGMLKQAKVPERIETLVAGESLFNDGVGVVAFTVLAGIVAATAGHHGGGHGAEMGFVAIVVFFLQEAVGGLLLGGITGYLAYLLLRSIEDFAAEMIISLGLVLGFTALASHLHVSAPLAAVAAGLLVGSLTDRLPTALSSREKYESTWHLIDELLNVFLFALLALEVMAVQFTGQAVILGLIAIPLVLIARGISVQIPASVLHRKYKFNPFTRRLLVWGGLRGAISVALAFTVPAGEQRELFLVMTYVVVVFSIVVQGLTVGRLAQKAGEAQDKEAAEETMPQYVRLGEED